MSDRSLQIPEAPWAGAEVLRASGLVVDRDSSVALDGAGVTLYAGEIHALMGVNGAGKSTLVAAVTGALPVVDGEIRLDGRVLGRMTTAQASAAGIASVYQEASLCGNLSVAENIMIGQEARGRFGIDWPETHRVARRTLSRLGLDDLDSTTPVWALPVAERQLVAIARAVVHDPRVLVLDEPTSSLEPHEVERLFSVLAGIRARGAAILFVSHVLEQVFAVSDRVTVLREGRDVGTFETDDIDRAELISVMLGQDLDSLRMLGSGTRPHRQEPEGDPIYRTDKLGLRGAVAPVDIDLYRGEILGFAGLRGSGRTEFANVMTGSLRADTGEARIDGRVVKMRDPAQALRLRLGMVTEDAADDGLVTGLTVRQNIVLARQALRGWADPVGSAEADTLVEELTESLSIPADLIDEPVDRLSTGNRRRVALARILATRPRVLILDDPTRGADVAAKAAIERKIERLAGDGVAIVYISSEMEDVVRLSDRIAIFRDREKIAEVSSGPGLSVDTIVELIADDSHYDM